MNEEEQLQAFFINGIFYITGSTKFAERVAQQIIKMKKMLWLVSLALWSLILTLWLIRA